VRLQLAAVVVLFSLLLGCSRTTLVSGSEGKERETGPGGYLQFRNLRTNNGQSEPAGARLAAIRQMRAMDQAANRYTPEWFSARGPINGPGHTRCIAINPRKPDIWLMATAGGGLWRSGNSGQTWVNCDDYRLHHSVSWVEYGSDGVAYIGTGEPYGSYDQIKGVGVYSTADNGQTFKLLTDKFVDVAQVRVLPSDPRRLFVLDYSGLYFSPDAGESWLQMSDVPHWSMAFSRGSSERIWAVGSNHVVSYCDDGGYTWAGKNPGIPDEGRKSIAVAPSDPNRLYIITGDAYAGRTSRVFICTNAAGAANFWSEVPLAEDDRPDADWWSNYTWVDPANSEHIVSCGRFVYESFNSGATFRQTQLGDMHADVHYVVEAPGYSTMYSNLLFCTDGGLYASALVPALNFRNAESLNRDVDSTQFYALDGFYRSSPPISRVVGGTQDNGTWLLDKGSNSGRNIYGGDGGYVAMHPTNPDAYFVQSQAANLARTIDNGQTFVSATTGIPNAGDLEKHMFITPIVQDPDKTSRMFMGTIGLYRCDNPWGGSAPSWTPIGGIPLAKVTALGLAPSDPWLYIGTANGDLWVLDRTKSGANATRVYRPGPGLPPDRAINCIAVDATNPQRIFLGFSGWSANNLWYSADGGSTWRAINGSGTGALPRSPVFSIAINPNNSQFIHVGTEVGVCYTTNRGTSWKLESTKMIGVSVWDLKYLKGSDYLVAATHGRGIWMAQPIYVDKIAPDVIQDEQDIDLVCSLTGPPPPQGASVSITSSEPTILKPLTQARFEAGVWTTYFKARVARISAPADVVLSANYGGSIYQRTITVIPAPEMSSFTMTPSTRVVGGVGRITSLVQLAAPVPVSPVTIRFFQSTPNVIDNPYAITIPKGQSRYIQAWNTFPVGRLTTVLTQTRHRGFTFTQLNSVIPYPLRASEISRGSVKGGDGSDLSITVNLDGVAPSGGVPIRLRSSDPAVTVPPEALIPEGTRSVVVPIQHRAVSSSRTVVIKVANDNNEVSSSFVLQPGDITSLSVSPTEVVGGAGQVVTGSVAIGQVAGPSGVVVNLSGTSRLTVPSSVKIPAGASSVTFSVKHATTAFDYSIETVTATLNGFSLTSDLALRLPEISTMSLSPTSVVGGSKLVDGKVTINAVAPAGGITILLTSDSGIATPTTNTIVIPAGKNVASFKISSVRPGASTNVTISATVSGRFISNDRILVVNP
jgi:photosystem II stability/assembly factor-like uncharacterized protein